MGPAAVSPATGARTSPREVRLPQSIERRASRRIETDELVVLSPRFSGRVLDISSTGLRIVTTTRLREGEQLSFRIAGEQRSAASAVVRWCTLDSVFETRTGEVLSLYKVGLALLHDPQRLSSDTPPS